MLVNINSRTRNQGTYTNFSVNLPALPPTLCKIKLLELRIPMTMYTFDGTKSIRFVEAATPGTTRNAYITGNYNETTILTAIQTAMNAAGTQTYTATYTAALNCITISAPLNFSLKFSGSDTSYHRLGFTQTDTISSNTFTGTRSINLSPTGTYFLSIDGLGLPSVTTGLPIAATYPIFLNAASYTYGTWQNDLYEPIPGTIGGNNTISIRLSHSDGSLVTLTDDWNFTFLIITPSLNE